MTISHSATIRDSLANLVVDAHDVGAGTAVLQLREGATVLVSFDLPDPSFSAAAAAIATLLGTPIATVGLADGSADNFVTFDKDGTQIVTGSVTGTGLGGDIEISNVSIATSQSVSLDSLTYEAPA